MYQVGKYDLAVHEDRITIQSECQLFHVSIPPEATSVEIWGTSFNEDKDDYCEYRFFKGDNMLSKSRINGY